MILIDSNGIVDAKIKNLDHPGVSLLRLDPETYLISNGLQDDLILIHEDQIDKSSNIYSKLENQVSLIVFSNDIYNSKLENIQSSYKISDLSYRNLEEILSLETLIKERIVLKSNLHSLALEMNEIIDNVDTQLSRVKKSYETKAPRRFKEFKGVKLLSKYAAGDSIGGEFLDSFIQDNKLFLLMSETSSYLASSSILELFSELKTKKKISKDIEAKLLLDIQREMVMINESRAKKDLSVHTLTVIVDLISLETTGHCFGNFSILSNQKIDKFKSNNLNLLNTSLQDGEFEATLDSFEKILFTSPGLTKNWLRHCPEKLIEEIVRSTEMSVLDILDEIFFELKKNIKTGYLGNDACAIILEVNKNAIHQI